MGIVKTTMMVVFQAMATNIRLIRKWAERTKGFSDPLAKPFPEHEGFEEIYSLGAQFSFPLFSEPSPHAIAV
jgi:hypothetical protein